LLQTKTDGNGNLYVGFDAPPSMTNSISNYIHPSLSVYVNDNFEHVITYPDFLLYPNEWNTMHLTARLVELLEHPQDCTKKVSSIPNNMHINNALDYWKGCFLFCEHLVDFLSIRPFQLHRSLFKRYSWRS
jgi:hypothetical protein